MEDSLAGILAVSDTIASGETEGKHLTFFTDGQLFGVPIADVVQIVGMQEITRMPDYPDYVKGIINLRGEILPVIDVRLRLGKPETEYDDRTCVIVSYIRGRSFGFIVDGVDEVTDIPEDRISQPPQMNADNENRYLTGVARLGEGTSEKIVLLMDTAKILGEEEFDTLTQVAK